MTVKAIMPVRFMNPVEPLPHPGTAMHMLGNAVVPVVACDVINALRKAA